MGCLSVMDGLPAVVCREPAITYREEWREVRDRLTAEQIRSNRRRGAALRACWAMRGLCREAERKGIDVTYWRELAAELEGRAEQ